MTGGPDRIPAPLGPGALAAVLGALVVLVGCGTAPYPGSSTLPGRQPLEAWISVQPDSLGNVQPIVQVSLPHAALVFRRLDDHYLSEVDVTAVAWRDGEQVGGGVGSSQAVAMSDAATRASTPLLITAPVLVRGDELVTIEVTAHVRGTARRWERRLGFTPRSFATMPLWISEVETDLVPASSGGLQVAAAADSVRLWVHLLRPRNGAPWPASGVELVSEVSGPGSTQPRRRATAVPAAAADQGTQTENQSWTVIQSWPVARLPFGRCELHLALEAEADADGQRWRLPREPALAFVNLTVPLHDDREWRRHLVWLDGQLPASRRDSLQAVPAAGRTEAWAEVWHQLGAQRDQTPAVAAERHLLRIVAADDRYGGFGRGALSDRGRILIRWGEPARIEQAADERVPGAVYEVWSVPRAGLRFVFYDAHGLGDFRLQQTLPLDL